MVAAGAGLGATYDLLGPRQQEVHLICFSKDRAFQLDQLLESADRHLQLVEHGGGEGDSGSAPPTVRLQMSVLYLTTDTAGGDGITAEDTAAPSPRGAGAPEDAPVEKATEASSSPSPTHGAQNRRRTMEESYSLVRRRHPGVKFVRERPGEFCDQLCSLLGEDRRKGAKGREDEDRDSEAAAFVLFAVDDMFFYRDFELPGALSLLTRGGWDSSTPCCE